MMHLHLVGRTANTARLPQFRTGVHLDCYSDQIDSGVIGHEGGPFFLPVLIPIKGDVAVRLSILGSDGDGDIAAESAKHLFHRDFVLGSQGSRQGESQAVPGMQ
jgi:hypothetical protein